MSTSSDGRGIRETVKIGIKIKLWDNIENVKK